MIVHLVIEKPDSIICSMTYCDGLVISKVFQKDFLEKVCKSDTPLLFLGPKPEFDMLHNLLESRIICECG